MIFSLCILLQLHGSAHGNGVYLSPDSMISFGYSSAVPAKTKPSAEVALAIFIMTVM